MSNDAGHATVKSVSATIADAVLARGLTTFGIMGNGNVHFVSSITARGGRYHSTRHEAGAVAASHVHRLSSGRIAVATTTYGPGFLNAMTPLAEARRARVPLVMVVGDAPAAQARPQDVDQTAVAAALDVATFVATPRNAASIAEVAFEVAERDRVPVVIAIPHDLQGTAVDVDDVVRAPTPATVIRPHELAQPSEVAAEQVAATAGLLWDAQRPLIIGGRGVHLSGAGDALREVGDRLGALFSSTLMGRNAFHSPWDVGISGGFASPQTAELIARADVVLVVGASMNLQQMRYEQLLVHATEVVQVDHRPGAKHHRSTRFVHADAAQFAAALLEQMGGVDAGEHGWRHQVADRVRAVRDVSDIDPVAPDGRLDPRVVMKRIGDLLPEDVVVVQDTGHFVGWAPRYWPVSGPESMVTPGFGFQVMGYGFGASVGAAAAHPGRLTALVVGDGGATMSLADLETLVRVAKHALVVVVNDAAYGMEVHQYAVAGHDEAAMLFPEVDYAAVGRALGATGRRIETPDDLEHLRAWLESGADGVFLADVVVSPSIVADWVVLSNDWNAAHEH